MGRRKTFQIYLNLGPINYSGPCEINYAIPLDLKYRPADALTRNGGRQ